MTTSPNAPARAAAMNFLERWNSARYACFAGLLPGTAVSGASTFEEVVKPAPDQPPQRFDHYELVTGEDGKPLELGRGAMGVHTRRSTSIALPRDTESHQ